jgi:hypothetical protein
MAQQIKSQWINIILLFYFVLIGTSVGYGQNTKAQIEGVINELKQSVSQMKVDEAQSQAYQRLISRTEAAVQSDKLFLSLVYLQQAWMNVRPDEFSLTKSAIAKQGIAGFDREWKKVAGEFKSKERSINANASTPQAVALKALMETALALTHPYHQSSRLYAVNADVGEALIYLGRSQAAMDFALFCKTIKLPVKGNFSRFSSIESELKTLEAEIVEAYKKPDAATRQRTFIQISVTLKTAEELNRDKRFAGALVKYLDALMELVVQETSVPDQIKLASLKSQSETLRKRLSSGEEDASIGLIYAEMAEHLLNQNSNVEENAKRAAAIIEKVLPAYFKITAKEK